MIPLNPIDLIANKDCQEQRVFTEIGKLIYLDGPNIPANIRYLLAADYTNFIVKAIAKFDAGQKEHGGRLTDRDLRVERENELIDLFHYHNAEKWPTK